MFRLNSASSLDIIKAKSIKETRNPARNFFFITGFATSPVTVSFDHFEYFAAFLNPIAINAIFGVPADELRDKVIEGSNLISELSQIEDALLSKTNFYDRANWLENWLYTKLIESDDLYTALSLNRLADKLAVHQHRVDGKQLEDYMGYSRAQTHRLFNRWFGLSSQKYQRLKKFVHTLEHVHSSEESLTSIGYQQGYFDQAHFIRSFKEFADITPSQYRKVQTDLIAQYSIT
jgi:AraC-like DNA-binding protein